MKAIKTYYLGATEKRPTRIKATDCDGNSVTLSIPHDANDDLTVHFFAAKTLAAKMDWHGTLAGGSLPHCMVWVFTD